MTEEETRPALSGIRVLELGTLIAGPFATHILADLGADVIKVEPPGKGDPLREWGFGARDGDSLWFAIQSRNKRSVVIDLRRPEGQRLVQRLVPSCDLVVENFQPGTLERWNLGWDILHRLNPRLILVRISGFGQTGPYRLRPGFGNIAESMGGIRYITGYPDRPPVRVGMSLADHVAALYAVIGALAALQARQVTGQGQVVDIALTESVFSFLQDALPQYIAYGRVQERMGNALQFAAPSNIYQTRDGHWIAISGNADSIFRRFMHAIGRDDLATDPDLQSNPGRVAREAELDEAIEAWTRAHTLEEVASVLEEAEVPYGPVYSIREIVNDPQYRARDMIVMVPHPRFGEVAMPGIVPRLSATPGVIRWPGPELGRDTDAVLRELAGVSEAELVQLREAGVIQ